MPTQNRHLAAIMLVRDPSPKAMASGDRSVSEGGFTDIVGYTRLMGEDEQKAMQVLRNNRKLHQSTPYHKFSLPSADKLQVTCGIK